MIETAAARLANSNPYAALQHTSANDYHAALQYLPKIQK
jgi:hypothetical protein